MKTYALLEQTRVVRLEYWENSEGTENLVFVSDIKVAWPASPSPAHVMHLIDGVLTFTDPRTLADVKIAKNAEINAARLIANRGSFVFAGKSIRCDELSRGDMDGVVGIIALTGQLPIGWVGGWKAIDNTFVAIPDVAAWTLFYGAMVTQGLTNFTISEGLKATLEAATTKAEVDAIQWP